MINDFRDAWRQMTRHRGFAWAALTVVAIGVAASTTAFNLVDAVLLRPLAYREPDRLVAVFEGLPQRGESRNPTSPANFLSWKEGSRTLDQMNAAHFWGPVLEGRGRPSEVDALKMTPGLFDLLGAEAELGRAFSPADASDPQVAVIGYRLWRERFGGDRQVLGESILLDGESYRIIGVMPADFQFPPFWAENASLWAPLVFSSEQAQRRGARFLRVFARLGGEASLEQAKDEMAALGDRLARQFPEDNEGIAVHVERLREPMVSGVRPALWALAGAVGLILAIACANLAGLLLVRGAARRREMAVRNSLGATRLRLMRQIGAESLLLACCGGLAGMLLGDLLTGQLLLWGPSDLPRLSQVAFTWRGLAFASLATLLTGLVAALASFWRLAGGRWEPSALRDSRGGGLSRSQSRLQSVLVAGQIALALALVSGAALMLQSFVRLLSVDPGLDREGRLVMEVSFAGGQRDSAQRHLQFLQAAQRAAASIPGVTSAGFVQHLHIGGDLWRHRLTAESSARDEPLAASVRVATAEFFPAAGLEVLSGESFSGRESSESEPVAMVNRALARRLWPDGGAAGQRLKPGRRDSDAPWIRVLGVVEDAPQRSLSDEVRPEIYFPYAQNPFPWYSKSWLLVRAAGDPSPLAGPLRERLWDLEPRLALGALRSLQGILSENVARPRFVSLLLAALSGSALLLAAVGLYGLMAYSQRRRRRETGVRMALGARPRDVLCGILRQGLMLTAGGAAFGLLLASALGEWLRSLLFKTSASDPAALAISAALLMAAGLAASLLPARRASRLDPAAVLREE